MGRKDLLDAWKNGNNLIPILTVMIGGVFTIACAVGLAINNKVEANEKKSVEEHTKIRSEAVQGDTAVRLEVSENYEKLAVKMEEQNRISAKQGENIAAIAAILQEMNRSR